MGFSIEKSVGKKIKLATNISTGAAFFNKGELLTITSLEPYGEPPSHYICEDDKGNMVRIRWEQADTTFECMFDSEGVPKK